MAKLIIHLKTLTPTMMMGVNNRRTDEPELRESTVRGVLRYWLRALIGRVVENDKELLSFYESQVFGNTDIGSPVRVKLSAGEDLLIDDNQLVLPDTLSFTATEPEGKIIATFSTHPLENDFPALFSQAALLGFRLGAFGRRSRRGGGNFEIMTAGFSPSLGSEPKLYKPFKKSPKNRGKLKQALLDDISFALRDWPLSAPFYSSKIPEYPIFAEPHAKVLLGEAHRDYLSALNTIWGIRQRPAFRGHPAFGDIKPRRASPVHMRVASTRSDNTVQYYPLMTVFRSEAGSSVSNWPLMQEFVDQCVKDARCELIFGKDTSGKEYRW